MGIRALFFGYAIGVVAGIIAASMVGLTAGLLTAWLGGAVAGLVMATLFYVRGQRSEARAAEFTKWDTDLDADRMEAEWRIWDADLAAEEAASSASGKRMVS